MANVEKQAEKGQTEPVTAAGPRQLRTRPRRAADSNTGPVVGPADGPYSGLGLG